MKHMVNILKFHFNFNFESSIFKNYIPYKNKMNFSNIKKNCEILVYKKHIFLSNINDSYININSSNFFKMIIMNVMIIDIMIHSSVNYKL